MINVDNDREENDMTTRCRKVKGKRLKVRAAKLTINHNLKMKQRGIRL